VESGGIIDSGQATKKKMPNHGIQRIADEAGSR